MTQLKTKPALAGLSATRGSITPNTHTTQTVKELSCR
jgi:hypothetical protein